LFLEPGYDLTISLDPLNVNAINFSGEGADANNYLYRSDCILNKYGKNFHKLNSFELINRIDSVKKDFAAFHTRYCDSTHLSKNTSRILELNNQIGLLSYELDFLNVHARDSLNKNNYPEQLLNISAEIPYNDDLLSFRNNVYAISLSMNLRLERTGLSLENKNRNLNFDERLPAMMNDCISRNKRYTAGVKEYLLARNIYTSMDSGGITHVSDSLLAMFRKTYSTSIYLQDLRILEDKYKAISPGRLAPDISGTTVDGQPFSLKELRGKVVYIDLWATWCAPCRLEFPFSKSIRERFHQDDKVVFLYVSIDKDLGAWRKMVTNVKEKLVVHIIQKNEEVFLNYVDMGVPRFILIDQEGKIVNSDAPKPSSGKVENQIRELLKKIKS